jgi:hypothetical protein
MERSFLELVERVVFLAPRERSKDSSLKAGPAPL